MPIIYIDVLLCLNLFVDFLLLSAVARILRVPHKRRRVVAGACVGALGSGALLLPSLPLWCTLLWQGLFAALMVRTAFRYDGWRSFVRRTGMLFLLSALFAGTAYFMYFLLSPQGLAVVNGVVYYDVSPLMLLGTTLLSYGAITLFERIARRQPRFGADYRITVRYNAKSVTLRALYDTGNGLAEYFSGSPVTVVQKSAVASVLPQEWDALLRGQSPEGVLPHGWRLIPFRTVGGDGLLPAFRPDRLTVTASNGSSRTIDGGYIAVTDRLWRGEYEALIGNDIVALFNEERRNAV